MAEAFVEGFVLGLGAAVPLGPVNILIMTNALKNYKNAVSIGFGAMSADITYLTLVIFGMFVFMQNKTIQMALTIFGSLFLLYIAYLIFKGRNDKIDIKSNEEVSKTTIVKNYLKGYTITLLNPYTIGFWVSVSAYIVSKNLSFVFTLLGLFCAILLWITLMPLLVYKTKHLFSQVVVKYISIIASSIMLFFAFGMIINILAN
jgi:L-lysine exporter family protein LysE/ArgO